MSLIVVYPSVYEVDRLHCICWRHWLLCMWRWRAALYLLTSPVVVYVSQTGCVDATNFMRAVVEGGQQTATIELVCQMHRDMSMKVCISAWVRRDHSCVFSRPTRFTAVCPPHCSQLDLNPANLDAHNRGRMDSGVSLSSNFTVALARCLICKVK